MTRFTGMHLYEGHLQSSWTHYSKLELCGAVVTVSFLKYQGPPLVSDVLLTVLHPLLENVLQTVDHFEISCLGAPFSWSEKPILHGVISGLYGRCSNGVPLIHFFQAEHKIQFITCPMWFLGFSNHEKWASRQILKWSMVCSTFLRSGWNVVRSALLAKGGTSKKRQSLHLH
jgi:hypothetical protein